jgi:hypothetical protein
MWIINFLPDWVFHTIFAIGLLGTIAGFLLGFIPLIKRYSLVIQVCSILILVLGVFLEGAMSDNKEWVARVKEMEAKVAAAEAKSQKVNVEIIEKVVKKTEYIKLRGQEIIKYVDRDIVKYDTRFAPGGQCEIPKEFITLHNKAAEAPK